MRIVLFLAIVANSLDLVFTALGIHWLGNREGNPLLASLVHGHWWLFVLLKGLGVPLLILKLDSYRRTAPVLAGFGMLLVTLVITVALGQWIGWMAGVLRVTGL